MQDRKRCRLTLAVLSLVACEGCSPIAGGTRSALDLPLRSLPVPYLGPFELLWAERTITLTQEHGARIPVSGMGSPGGFTAFPMTVHATYMDSTLIREGIREFAHLGSMSDEEAGRFLANYSKSHASEDSLFIWVEMQTSGTEEFLRLDRWTMFLENEAGRQIEPARIVDHPPRRQEESAMASGELPERESAGDLPGQWSPVRKQVELYFPSVLNGAANSPTKGAGLLKFEIFETKNPHVRAEGAWQVSDTSVSRAER